MRIGRALVKTGVVLAVVCAPGDRGQAWAMGGPSESSPRGSGREALQAGLAAFEQEDYAVAIEHFERAYALDRDPAYLYAWAQAARLAGDCEAAVDLYRRFVDAGAEGAQREAALQNEARCREQLAAAQTSPTEPEPEPEPTAEPEVAVRPSDDLPRSRRRPDPLGLSLLVTGSVAAVAGSVVLGVGEGRRIGQARETDYDRFDSLDAQIDRFHIAGGVTLGVGVALAIGGVVRLLIVRRRSSLARVPWPSLSLHAGGIGWTLALP
ncbi:MAG: tetratricopeptide repeat protein [Myxococcota bacterium]